MPNHIRNRVRFAGSKKRIEKLMQFVQSKDEEFGEVTLFDFNKIIPMPKELDIESNSLGTRAMFVLYKVDITGMYKKKDYNKIKADFDSLNEESKKEQTELGEKYYQNYVKYGAPNWYEWSIRNWGTKWNAYDFDYFEQYPNEVNFQTAWTCPLIIFTKLSTLFPDITIEVAYADEDIGNNVGIIYLENGKPLELNIPKEQSVEAYEIYFDLNPEMSANFKRVGDTYIYIKN